MSRSPIPILDNLGHEIFWIHNLVTGDSTQVNVGADGVGFGTGGSDWQADISGDGNHVGA